MPVVGSATSRLWGCLLVGGVRIDRYYWENIEHVIYDVYNVPGGATILL
jgi:hypothetical protein